MFANEKYNLGRISEKRDTIYSIAIFWIMFFHTNTFYHFPMNFLYNIQKAGNIGVDIFLFVSGISLYFSFQKDRKLLHFYKKRMKRVILPALIIGIPYFGARDLLMNKTGIIVFLSNVTGISLFTSRVKTIWFFTAIVLFYLVYPILYKIFESREWKITSLICTMIIILGGYYFIGMYFPVFWHNSEILLRRFPIFVIGVYCGKYVFEEKKIFILDKYILLLGIICLSILGIGISCIEEYISIRYCYAILCIPITMMFSLIKISDIIKKFFHFIAGITFEIYLVNEKSNNMVIRIMRIFNCKYVLLQAILGGFLTIAMAILLYKFEIYIKKLISHVQK